MKVLCVIDHFGPGGAQRQLVNLTVALKNRGHEVEVFIYFPEHDFFRRELSAAGVPVLAFAKGRGFSPKTVQQLARVLREGHYDAVLSFLDTPNVYTCLAGFLVRVPKLVVSERSSYLSDKAGPLKSWLRYALFSRADIVVANSHSHSAWLRRIPWLKSKIATSYNGYPLGVPSQAVNLPADDALLVIGRVGPEKNALRLVEALRICHERYDWLPGISWAGADDTSASGREYLEQVRRALDAAPVVRAKWRWLGPRKDVPDLLRDHSALIHPSLYEGLPNAVCEALIAGRPVLASAVCDHPLLLEDGSHGLLFDPRDSGAIASAIRRFFELSVADRAAMGKRARLYAEQHLGLDRMVSRYEALLGPNDHRARLEENGPPRTAEPEAECKPEVTSSR